jgi:hypothetical protein
MNANRIAETSRVLLTQAKKQTAPKRGEPAARLPSIEELEARGVILTRRIEEAEARGDTRQLDRLLNRKTQLNRKRAQLHERGTTEDAVATTRT